MHLGTTWLPNAGWFAGSLPVMVSSTRPSESDGWTLHSNTKFILETGSWLSSIGWGGAFKFHAQGTGRPTSSFLWSPLGPANRNPSQRNRAGVLIRHSSASICAFFSLSWSVCLAMRAESKETERRPQEAGKVLATHHARRILGDARRHLQPQRGPPVLPHDLSNNTFTFQLSENTIRVFPIVCCIVLSMSVGLPSPSSPHVLLGPLQPIK